jgi:F-box interacting protein
MSNRLPRDLWTEILVSLPVKSLLRFQCVCKSWKSLISSPRFISMHTQHSESTGNYAHILRWIRLKDTVTPYQYLHIDGSFNEFQEIEYPCQMRGRNHGDVLDCKGLILLTTFIEDGLDDNRFELLTLWNPAIRMSMTLPRPRIDVPEGKHCVHGFGFDHTSNDYKVLRMVNDYKTLSPLQAELYRLRTGTWETFTGADDEYAIHTNPQAFVNGASHWVACHMASGSRQLAVVLFDMRDEQLRVMKLPDNISISCGRALLSVSGGLLSFMEYNDERQDVNLNCSIWLMKEYGVAESWTKQFTIDLKAGWSFGEIFCFTNNEKILAWNRKNEKESVLYDPKTHRFITIGDLGIKAKDYLLSKNTLVGSLVLLDKISLTQTCQTCLRKGQWCDSKKGNKLRR